MDIWGEHPLVDLSRSAVLTGTVADWPWGECAHFGMLAVMDGPRDPMEELRELVKQSEGPPWRPPRPSGLALTDRDLFFHLQVDHQQKFMSKLDEALKLVLRTDYPACVSADVRDDVEAANNCLKAARNRLAELAKELELAEQARAKFEGELELAEQAKAKFEGEQVLGPVMPMKPIELHPDAKRPRERGSPLGPVMPMPLSPTTAFRSPSRSGFERASRLRSPRSSLVARPCDAFEESR